MATVTHTIKIQCADDAEFAAFAAHVTQQQQNEDNLAGATREDNVGERTITVAVVTQESL